MERTLLDNASPSWAERATRHAARQLGRWFSAAIVIATATASAEDVVVIAGKDGQEAMRSAGQILDYTGRGLVLRHSSGREQTLPANQVLELQSVWVAPHVTGDEKYQQGRYEEALTSYRDALAAETRPWAKRRILSQCVWCFQRTGQAIPAARAFLQICQQDQETPYFETIPLPWETRPVSPELTEQSRKWIAANQIPAARLIGASWLLSTAHRAEATATLRQLSADSQPAVAFLASAQLWRTTLPTSDAAEADRWQAFVERMPESLQPGPLLLLAQLQSRLERHEQSALTYLKVAILHSRHADLAARSLLGAGGELEKIGQRDEAARLYDELVAQYPEATDAVSAAQQRIKAMTQPPTEKPLKQQ